MHPTTGALYDVEHGPRGGDELNLVEKGKNYGWPVITYGMNYNGTPMTDKTAAPGMEQPLTYWVPSIAVSSIGFYTGSKFPAWKGNLFLGSLAAQELRRLELTPTGVKQEVLFKNVGRLRDVVMGPDGAIYIAFNQPDRIARIVPASATRHVGGGEPGAGSTAGRRGDGSFRLLSRSIAATPRSSTSRRLPPVPRGSCRSRPTISSRSRAATSSGGRSTSAWAGRPARSASRRCCCSARSAACASPTARRSPSATTPDTGKSAC